MKHNVGGIDKALRIGGGIALIALAATDVFAPWGWIGIIPLVTGVFGFCPFYPLLGLSTCPTRE